MRTQIFASIIGLLLLSSNCFSQPDKGNPPPKPPTIDERLKMIDEKICQPLNLTQEQSVSVKAAFKEFFTEADKIMGPPPCPPKRDEQPNPFKLREKPIPPPMPDKSKIDALAKIRDDKVKLAIPEALYPKYFYLEKTTRPPKPPKPQMEK